MLGPSPGRYLLRERAGDEPDHVLVVATLGAPERRRLARRSRSAAPAPAPTPVPTTRATVIHAGALESGETARRWLAAADGPAESAAALAIVNRALHGHRVASADPFVREVSEPQALVVRIGYGDGEQVAEGRWADAHEVVYRAPRTRRAVALHPQERLAALLGGRDAPLACEELALRARLDFDSGRVRESALEMRIALEAALAELQAWADRPGIAERLNGLRELRGVVGSSANAAIAGGLDDAQVDELGRALERLEAALRARAALGVD